MEHMLERYSPELCIKRSGIGYVSVLGVDDFLDTVVGKLWSMEGNEYYLSVHLIKYCCGCERKWKEKYDRRSECEKNDFDRKKVKRRR